MSNRRSQCEECGYDLTGHPASRLSTCPECGSLCDPWFSVEPWPRWWVMVLRLCGPAALFVVVLMAARMVPGAGWYAVMAWPVLLPAWVLLAVALPFDRARTMSQRSALRPARKRRRAAMAMAAIAVNVAGTTVGLFVWR